MPYDTRKAGKKWETFNSDTGATVPGGTHDTEAEAVAHKEALYSNVEDAQKAVGPVMSGASTEAEPPMIEEASVVPEASKCAKCGQEIGVAKARYCPWCGADQQSPPGPQAGTALGKVATNTFAQNFFIPITKVDEEHRQVWGYAAVEEPDVSGEIMDWNTSNPHF
jgi:hypothetical protein